MTNSNFIISLYLALEKLSFFITLLLFPHVRHTNTIIFSCHDASLVSLIWKFIFRMKILVKILLSIFDFTSLLCVLKRTEIFSNVFDVDLMPSFDLHIDCVIEYLIENFTSTTLTRCSVRILLFVPKNLFSTYIEVKNFMMKKHFAATSILCFFE